MDAMEKPAAGARTWLWDDQVRGFGVMMTAQGRKSYILQYRVGRGAGPNRRLRIGTHGSPWTPEAARDRAVELMKLVADGVDPANAEADAERVSAADASEREHFAFGNFADRFIEKHVVAGGLRSRKDIEGTFDRDLRPKFGDKSVLAISKQDVKDLLAHVGDRSRSAANKAHKWLNRMFTWGMKHDRLEDSPMFGLTKPFPESKRDRVLSDTEIRLLVRALNGITWQFATLVLLLLLTGQRLREVAGMRWDEIDLAKREWIIPGSRTKNKRRHLVPLSSQVVKLLRSVRAQGSDEDFVLTTNGKTVISGFSKSKKAIDVLIAARTKTAVPAWVMHDLRRTFATGCAALTIPIEHSEAVLNHVSGTQGGVAGVYHLYKYVKEKRVALQTWADRVEKVLGGLPSPGPT
ncbi:tyrosine-type recombinase/integrase [uncultured Sphingomonas sp.]|uniref:tyrosine-type recombinase/integrase n=1 Tax=uncultured Sphingomonas sp. TaxID=158754 RepID=UPI0035C96923